MRMFEHNSKEHFLPRMDARIKILVAVTGILLVLSYRGTSFPLLMTAACLSLCLMIRVPLKSFVLRFGEPLFIITLLLIIKCLFSGKEILFSVKLPGFLIKAHRDGLVDGLHIGSRILGSVSVVAFLSFSTPFTEFMAALAWFRIPRSFIEILIFAYRAVFFLREDALVIYSAQKNRLGYSSIRRGLSSFGVLGGSLLIKAFDNSQNTTIAMTQRGYDGTMPLLKQRPFRLPEVLVSVLVIALMGIIWTQ